MSRAICLIVGFLILAATNVVGQSSAQSVQTGEKTACPTVWVECPNEVIGAQPYIFKARVVWDPLDKLTYEWSVYGGIVLEGQGTATLKVQRTRPLVSGMTATLSLKGLPSHCSSTASCSLIFENNAPRAVLFDTYRWVPDEVRKQTQRVNRNKRRPKRTVKPTITKE